MIEEMQMRAQKRIEESQAANQKKIEGQLAAMALAQKAAELQQSKVEERLAAMVSEQNAAQLRHQTTLSDEVKRSAPAKPDYSNLKCINCGKMGHSVSCRTSRCRPWRIEIVSTATNPGISDEIA